MSQRLCLVVACLGIAALLAACGEKPRGDPLQRIRTRGELIVAHEVAFEPFEYKDPKTGEVVGFDVDLVQELARDLGVRVKFRNMDFDSLGTDLTTGRSDLIVSGLTVNAEREQLYAFSTPYFYTWTGLLVSRRKAPDVRSVKDLDREGRTVAVQAGSTGIAAAAKACPKAKVVLYKTENDAVLEVVQGRVDAFLYDLAPLRKDFERNPETTILLPEPISSEPYAVAARKTEPEVVAWLNAALAKMRADGRLQAMVAKHKPDGSLDPLK